MEFLPMFIGQQGVYASMDDSHLQLQGTTFDQNKMEIAITWVPCLKSALRFGTCATETEIASYMAKTLFWINSPHNYVDLEEFSWDLEEKVKRSGKFVLRAGLGQKAYSLQLAEHRTEL